MIQPLQLPDSIHLQAAEGWIGLGNCAEANDELERIAAAIASAIVKMVPEWPSRWIYRASSLTELNRQQEAYETLSAAAALFPRDEIIPYDLACVCCAMARLAESKSWLGKAIDAGGNEIKLRALDDPDLEPLWKNIGNL